MDTAQWPQDIVVKPMEEIVPKSNNSSERKVRPQKEQALNCPRCNATNTKFCYYNNYSLSQPRYFCKTCRRYWTEGGSLRNIPVGGGSRKNKRSSSSSKKLPELVPPPPLPPKTHEGQDLNLGFPATTHDFKTITELIQVPNYDSTMNNNKDSLVVPTTSSSGATSSPHLSSLELLTAAGGISSRGLSSFMPILPVTDSNTVFTSGFSLPEFKPSLNFSLDGLGYGSLPGVQEANGRLFFPFEDLKQVSSSTTTDHVEQNRDHQHGGDSTGYWSGVLGSGGSW